MQNLGRGRLFPRQYAAASRADHRTGMESGCLRTRGEVMKLFQDLPIQQKMLVMTLLICGAVLFVAIAALFTFQVLNFRSNFQRDTATLAVIIANNSTAAMAFKDDHRGGSGGRALPANPLWSRPAWFCPTAPCSPATAKLRIRSSSQFPPAGQYQFLGGQLLVTQPVNLKGRAGGHALSAVRLSKNFFANCSVFTPWSFSASWSSPSAWRCSFPAAWDAGSPIRFCSWRGPPRLSAKKKTTRCARPSAAGVTKSGGSRSPSTKCLAAFKARTPRSAFRNRKWKR